MTECCDPIEKCCSLTIGLRTNTDSDQHQQEEDQRFQSFDPFNLNKIRYPRSFANAGFWYQSHDRSIRCYACNLVFKIDQVSKEKIFMPWPMHILELKECPHLKLYFDDLKILEIHRYMSSMKQRQMEYQEAIPPQTIHGSDSTVSTTSGIGCCECYEEDLQEQAKSENEKDRLRAQKALAIWTSIYEDLLKLIDTNEYPIVD